MGPQSFSMHLLEHRDPVIAAEIHGLLLAAYAVEARLLGVADFPPLARTVQQVRAAIGSFYGIRQDDRLLAIAEISQGQDSKVADIDSFVVAPANFRQGIGNFLLRELLTRLGESVPQITVSTGHANEPAIRLYRKCGFRPQTNWTHSNGLEMVTLIWNRDL